jgi:hypothetical protein
MIIKNNFGLWSDLTFKTQGYRKNFDLINDNENIITEYEGIVSKMRIVENKPPLIIGEYSISVCNIELGKLLDVDLEKLMMMTHILNYYMQYKKN